MQEIRSSNPPVVTGICAPNKSRARYHRSLNIFSFPFANFCFRQNTVVQDIGSSHLDVFCNLGVPLIPDKFYSLKILENTLTNEIDPLSVYSCAYNLQL